MYLVGPEHVYALDTNDGSELWSYQHNDENAVFLGISPLVLPGGQVIAVDSNGKILSLLGENGAIEDSAWPRSGGGNHGRYSYDDRSPKEALVAPLMRTAQVLADTTAQNHPHSLEQVIWATPSQPLLLGLDQVARKAHVRRSLLGNTSMSKVLLNIAGTIDSIDKLKVLVKQNGSFKEVTVLDATTLKSGFNTILLAEPIDNPEMIRLDWSYIDNSTVKINYELGAVMTLNLAETGGK